MAWLWRNIYLAAAVSAVVALVLVALDQGTLASFAFMILGTLLMMQGEVSRDQG